MPVASPPSGARASLVVFQAMMSRCAQGCRVETNSSRTERRDDRAGEGPPQTLFRSATCCRACARYGRHSGSRQSGSRRLACRHSATRRRTASSIAEQRRQLRARARRAPRRSASRNRSADRASAVGFGQRVAKNERGPSASVLPISTVMPCACARRRAAG